MTDSPTTPKPPTLAERMHALLDVGAGLGPEWARIVEEAAALERECAELRGIDNPFSTTAKRARELLRRQLEGDEGGWYEDVEHFLREIAEGRA